jgi:hypothetical protein
LNKSIPKNQSPKKSYEFDYEPQFQAMVLRIIDTDGMFPLILIDPDNGPYKIHKTSTGKLQMVK